MVDVVTVIFRSRLRDEGDAEYAELAPKMVELARTMPGFVSFERFTAAEQVRSYSFDGKRRTTHIYG